MVISHLFSIVYFLPSQNNNSLSITATEIPLILFSTFNLLKVLAKGDSEAIHYFTKLESKVQKGFSKCNIITTCYSNINSRQNREIIIIRHVQRKQENRKC